MLAQNEAISSYPQGKTHKAGFLDAG